ncbi:MAG: hypothetical protein ACTSR2_08715 [Candidatus Hodarchaeales archaeon]
MSLREMSISSNELRVEVNRIRIFAVSVIFSATAVASSTVFLFVPNLETLSLFFFIVGYRYGVITGTATVVTSVSIYEIFASQVYGSGGPIPFLFKFPPFLLIMLSGFLFHRYRAKIMIGTNTDVQSEDVTLSEGDKVLYNPFVNSTSVIYQDFTRYERFLLAQLGFVLTIVYDIFTSFSMLVFVPSLNAVFLSLIPAFPFFLVHQITNFVFFYSIPSIIVALDKARFRA